MCVTYNVPGTCSVQWLSPFSVRSVWSLSNTNKSGKHLGSTVHYISISAAPYPKTKPSSTVHNIQSKLIKPLLFHLFYRTQQHTCACARTKFTTHYFSSFGFHWAMRFRRCLIDCYICWRDNGCWMWWIWMCCGCKFRLSNGDWAAISWCDKCGSCWRCGFGCSVWMVLGPGLYWNCFGSMGSGVDKGSRRGKYQK